MAMKQAELGEFGFAGDDRVVPFQVEGLDVRGRAVQLGPLINTILDRHAYPAPVARLLAEAIVLTVLIGTSLKFEGRFTVQTKGDGPVELVLTSTTLEIVNVILGSALTGLYAMIFNVIGKFSCGIAIRFTIN